MHKFFISFFLTLTTVLASSEKNNNCKEIDHVTIVVIDKISGNVKHIKAKIGQPIAYKRSRAVVRKAFKTINNSNTYSTTCFIDLYAIPTFAKSPEKIFSNWMFTENPSLNMLEHPMFDVAILND